MKPVIGMLLIFLGLVIGYMVMVGKLPAAQGGGTMPTRPTVHPVNSRNFTAYR